MPEAEEPFDDPFESYGDSYVEAVDDVIAFSHQGHEFFTRAKVDHLVELIRRHIGDPAGVRVLDFGCGPGRTDAMLAPSVGEVVGVDVSEALIVRARRDNPDMRFLHYDGERLPFDDDTFDVTFAVCVMHHVPPAQWQAASNEMVRVTKPGGLSVIFEHNPRNPLTRKAVNDCAFDEGVTLLSRRQSTVLQRGSGATPVEGRYILFVPVSQSVSYAVDRALGWLPLGGQYYVASRPA